MRSFIIVAFMLGQLTNRLSAQTISLDLQHVQDYLREQQLLGKVDSSLSFMMKPLHADRLKLNDSTTLDEDSIFPKEDPYMGILAGSRKGVGKLRWQLLPLHQRVQLNSIHNYGWQNGPMVSNRGWQSYYSAGVSLRWSDWLEFQFRPEYVWAQNQAIANPPVRHQGIDMPERMGTGVFREAYAGQSYVKFHWRNWSAGVSTENLQWGPARQGSIFISPSAPGFLHFTLHTRTPLKTIIGDFEGQFVGGRLRYSGFFPYPIEWELPTTLPIEPYRAPDITPSPLGRGEHSKISMITANYQPKWVRGLFVGGAFGVQSSNAPWPIGLFGVFAPGRESNNAANPYTQNAILSIFSRYLLPSVNMEMYAEIGRDDWFASLADLAVDPAHSTVYVVGVNKIFPLAGRSNYLRFEAELTQLMPPLTQVSRAPGFGFYTHVNGVGWTHRGQNLGVGLPPGSTRQQMGLLWNKGQRRWGFSFERIEYAQDLFYFRMPFLLNPNMGNSLAMDYNHRFVDLISKCHFQIAKNKVVFGSDFMIRRTHNFQWQFAPNGQRPEFQFHRTFWTINLYTYISYRLG
ncbi:MAG: hypothetical protein C0424_11935 [Sphingobacteriaceae bacterium]|nr:hypothetical protein [Sphingobacteriaceae bacterium]